MRTIAYYWFIFTCWFVDREERRLEAERLHMEAFDHALGDALGYTKLSSIYDYLQGNALYDDSYRDAKAIVGQLLSEGVF